MLSFFTSNKKPLVNKVEQVASRLFTSTYKLNVVLRDGKKKEIKYKKGETLYDAATNNKVFAVLGQCGGNMSCTQCQIYTKEEDFGKLYKMRPQEKDALGHANERIEERSRLSCGLILDENADGIEVEMAPLRKRKKKKKRVKKNKKRNLHPQDTEYVPKQFDSTFSSAVTKIVDDIYWAGYVDFAVRDFHGYLTPNGSTYNAYFIKDEKNVAIDSVKYPFADRWLDKIEYLSGGFDKLDYIVCNHAEPDHSSSIQYLMKKAPYAEVVCNEKCKTTLSQHFDTSDWKFRVVNHGESLKLGKRTLSFYNTPLSHWPESMVSYLAAEQILFSMDILGQHYASSKRFDDEVKWDDIEHEAKIYYANILMRLSVPVQKSLKLLGGVPVKMILPSHGQIFRNPENINKMVQNYVNWSKCTPTNKIVIIYDTMWNSTEKMAYHILDGIQKVGGVDVKLMNVRRNHITDIATEVLDCAAIVVGSPVLNEHIMPEIGSALTYLEGLRPQNKLAMAFGSYGWSAGGAVKDINRYLNSIRAKIVRPEVLSQFAPNEDVIEECHKAGEEMAKAVLEHLKK
ncbi:anaerobic nitric oxide reductase flavorubredoxin [Anaeramoeba flamelloides]|uniref:Anaerobic nitric oxide reductase flavorubredoxin n=1 Tax=Anaeramoeba flamelloides TaxID=1746091 RepID=A0AAV7ZZF0_9EUKA|nr:anaerobic nitric oxide reductase flavorubredoxin [Anaeramoeba flamelloides]KAJ6233352.1 anaerobic nitric oxide reductase flavorubredoxin [Anaeramoeba flamelloides]|eukprot:Anaeramoba_flamelloidesa1053474_1591.p1 GENE.a1053474_1591~~a1053474_1591.p1  ORF type:complete len:569 (+),score=99.93 a1053474_1591:15-1721(+)